MDWERPPHRGQGPGNVPDLEQVLTRLKDRFQFPWLKGSPFWPLALIVLVAVAAFNSYYTVEPQETAVVQRFGRFVRTEGPGLHFKIPLGVERVTKVLTGRVLQREYGYRTVAPGVRSRFSEKGFEEESRMLSGDLNVVDIQWTVQYKVRDPAKYLFRLKDVEETLDDISESVVRRIVGNRYADEVLTVGRASIAGMARQEIQQIMDTYHTGLQIITVKLQNANPPEPVKAAFNEVNEARQEKERMINEAEQVYNQRIPKARGQARQTITQAEGYATERVNRARGEVARFQDILAEYRKAPDVTRRRMYLEAMAEFAQKAGRLLILDTEKSGVLPLLNLNDLVPGAGNASATPFAGGEVKK
ncbi:protease FtsH subunit HflK [Desulfacinum hydrothermale DSM 13146]|uniref:Protein HflK n=1 Tax=Desulfacinum hydrothermale DSM 13146 TaxID=1121390 RepID=A0A1W1X5Q9_9BACT|nr:FtsH protease activity modulator HflK [Desulfacinum hydrothermale]SMC18801.1 protease FtsH subunit HflK [Desulfacinum hydrothermale DSM 13146]